MNLTPASKVKYGLLSLKALWVLQNRPIQRPHAYGWMIFTEWYNGLRSVSLDQIVEYDWDFQLVPKGKSVVDYLISILLSLDSILNNQLVTSEESIQFAKAKIKTFRASYALYKKGDDAVAFHLLREAASDAPGFAALFYFRAMCMGQISMNWLTGKPIESIEEWVKNAEQAVEAYNTNSKEHELDTFIRSDDEVHYLGILDKLKNSVLALQEYKARWEEEADSLAEAEGDMHAPSYIEVEVVADKSKKTVKVDEAAVSHPSLKDTAAQIEHTQDLQALERAQMILREKVYALSEIQNKYFAGLKRLRAEHKAGRRGIEASEKRRQPKVEVPTVSSPNPSPYAEWKYEISGDDELPEAWMRKKVREKMIPAILRDEKGDNVHLVEGHSGLKGEALYERYITQDGAAWRLYYYFDAINKKVVAKAGPHL